MLREKEEVITALRCKLTECNLEFINYDKKINILEHERSLERNSFQNEIIILEGDISILNKEISSILNGGNKVQEQFMNNHNNILQNDLILNDKITLLNNQNNFLGTENQYLKIENENLKIDKQNLKDLFGIQTSNLKVENESLASELDHMNVTATNDTIRLDEALILAIDNKENIENELIIANELIEKNALIIQSFLNAQKLSDTNHEKEIEALHETSLLSHNNFRSMVKELSSSNEELKRNQDLHIFDLEKEILLLNEKLDIFKSTEKIQASGVVNLEEELLMKNSELELMHEKICENEANLELLVGEVEGGDRQLSQQKEQCEVLNTESIRQNILIYEHEEKIEGLETSKLVNSICMCAHQCISQDVHLCICVFIHMCIWMHSYYYILICEYRDNSEVLEKGDGS